MKTATFRKRVYENAPPGLEREYLKAGVVLFLQEAARGEPTAGDVEACIELARTVKSSLAESPDNPAVLTSVPAVPEESRRVAEAVRPLVEKVRSLIFDRTEPPFTDREHAVKWLRETADAQERPRRGDVEESWKMIFEAQSRIKKPLKIETVSLPYIDPQTGSVEHLEGFFGSPIHLLHGQSEALADITGFSLVGTIEHILLGIAPLLPAYRIEKTWVPVPGEDGKPKHITRSVTVEINTRHLNEEGYSRIHKEVDRAFNPAHRKPARARTVLLINTVRRCMEKRPEGENKTEFWKRVQREFNRNAGGRFEKYRTWQAPRRTYLRSAETSEFGHLPVPD